MDKKSQIKIDRVDFDSIDDRTLVWTCIEPTIQKIRGRNMIVKSQTYSQLTFGQKSLLMFWILFGHAHYGMIHFFKEVDYLLTETDMWMEFKDKFKCFGNNDLLSLIDEMQSLYDSFTKTNFISPDLQLAADKLDRKYNDIIPNLFIQVCRYIRNNPNEFVYFKDRQKE